MWWHASDSDFLNKSRAMSLMQVKPEDETGRTIDDEKRAGGAADEVRNNN